MNKWKLRAFFIARLFVSATNKSEFKWAGRLGYADSDSVQNPGILLCSVVQFIESQLGSCNLEDL